MDLHEYQAKQLLKQYGIAIGESFLVEQVDELKQGLLERGWESCVIKAQIHSGARGKAGAVRLAKTRDQAFKDAEQMLRHTFITEQTGTQGKVAHQLLIEPISAIARELYIAITYDRAARSVALIASSYGGIHVEEHATDASTRCRIDIPSNRRLYNYQLWEIAKTLRIEEPLRPQLFLQLQALTQLFFESDATLLEINPWAVTLEGHLIALDAKLSIDDNALFRQKKLAAWDDPRQSSELEVRARAHDLAYIAMDGTIGCMVNGAGLAMATMDLLHMHGGRAANFLDVGGGANEERIGAGFEIVCCDPKVQVIFVHIFGGIMDCAVIAKGLISSLPRLTRHPPLVIRLEGNNVEQAKSILKNSALQFQFADTLDQAARLCVQIANALGATPVSIPPSTTASRSTVEASLSSHPPLFPSEE